MTLVARRRVNIEHVGYAALATLPPLMLFYEIVLGPTPAENAIIYTDGVGRFLALTVVGLCWGITGLLMLRRHQQEIIRLIFLQGQVLAISILYPLTHPPPWVDPPGLLWLSIPGFYFLAPLTLHLNLTFPIRLGKGRNRRLLLAIIYSGAIASVLAWRLNLPVLKNAGEIYTIGTFVISVCVLIYSYFFRSTPDSRRRMRVIWVGTLLGIIPSNVLFFVPGLYGWPVRIPVWAVSILLILTPLSFLFAITRHNLFGFDRLLNRTLVYFFLSTIIFAAYFPLLTYIYDMLPGDWLLQSIFSAGLTLIIAWNFTWLQARAQKVVDRLFLGNWYDYPAVVDTVSNALAACQDRQQVAVVLTRQIPALMGLHEGRLLIADQFPTLIAENSSPLITFTFSLDDGQKMLWQIAGHLDGEDFRTEDKRILNTVASEAEIALRNACLVEALSRKLEDSWNSRETLAAMQRQMLRSREDERARLARDLHDGPLQSLAGINLQFGMLLAGEDPGTSEEPIHWNRIQDQQLELEGMRIEVRGLINELREVCAELRPPLLDMLGLGAAIETLSNEWSAQNGIAVSVEISASSDWRCLPEEVAVNLFRVTQEALTNVARHAQANHVNIRLTGEPDQVQLTIADNGRGFDAQAIFSAQPVESGHFGLVGMQERVELIGGKWILQSNPGQGTSIVVQWTNTEIGFSGSSAFGKPTNLT